MRLIRSIRFLGSLHMAAPVLLTIATVLAWGTMYETRFGTAAVQRAVYQSWWFQTLLAFLAVNLAFAALSRYPWKRQHAPFVLAHLGIILILLGGIIGGRWGLEGTLTIPEGQAERMLQLPRKVLVVRALNPGTAHVFPTHFEASAWDHEPNAVFRVPLEQGQVELTVERYYPNAVVEEEVTDGGAEEFPAIRLEVRHGEQADTLWLLARDPERFGIGWGEAHLLFLEPSTEAQLTELLAEASDTRHPRGVITLTFPRREATYEVPVPADLSRRATVGDSGYTLAFRDYFPDFAITEQGLVSRSMQPNNPAVSFTLEGPEGSDAYLLFALHPDFQQIHGFVHRIAVEARYVHSGAQRLPPNAVVFLRHPDGTLTAILIGEEGQREVVRGVQTGQTVVHPWLHYEVRVAAVAARAAVEQRVTNRSDEVRAEVLRLIGRDGARTASAWAGLGQVVEWPLGPHGVSVQYRQAEQELPVTVKLLDFRKTEYPGTSMAAGFESDVELSDPQRGLLLIRTIRMNQPLRYRGYHFYQSSFIEGPVETTVLSVRNDPGTPFVYAGFLIVIGGVASMFLLRGRAARPRARKRRR